MNLVFTVYSLFFLATALVSISVAFLAWQRRDVKSARELAYLMVAAGFGAFWLIFETAAPGVSEKVFWSKLEFIGGIATPVLYLIFVLRFTGKDKYLNLKQLLLLFIVPVITLALTLTNEHHGLIWSGYSAISGTTNLMEYYHGAGFWIGYIAYTYLLLFLATILLLRFTIHQNAPFRSQGMIVFIGGLCPWIASFVYLSGQNPVKGLDITPASITLSGLLGAYAILNFRFLDLVPVARETLVETLPDGILVLDGQNRIQDINGSAMAFLGIGNKNIIGSLIQSSGASVSKLLNAVLDQETLDQKVELPSKDETESRTFRILKHSIKNQAGSRLVIIREISDQVAWQKEIQAGEDRYRHLFSMFRLMADNTDDFLWAKDIDNQYTFVNKTMADRLLIAESVNEPIGKTDIFFANRERNAHPENPDWHTFGEICADTDTITIEEEKPKQFDEFGNIQGKFLFLDVHKAPIWDENGHLIGVVGTGRDVTLTKQLEKEKSIALELLQNSEDNLRRINVEKDKFFSIIAHDLKSPFSAFLSCTKMMVDQLPTMTQEEIHEIAYLLSQSAMNLYQLLENLLEWSLMQRSITRYDPKYFLLNPTIKDSLQLILESAHKKGIEFSYIIPDEIQVFADENMLKSTIRNLATNALKFTAKGGKVTIVAKSGNGQGAEISILDSGIGMDKEMLDQLFRLDAYTSRTGTDGEPSTGLGLLLCKDFVEKHGGRIWAESEAGKGSAFHFNIPFPSEVNE
ncbi:MAG TPA: histidine kinase N-terminal 7TM domain-containing protein [Prolixibacteraceae bacterium]|jgi:signal transduction histidine kinase